MNFWSGLGRAGSIDDELPDNLKDCCPNFLRLLLLHGVLLPFILLEHFYPVSVSSVKADVTSSAFIQ
jgi:hypothetical protein